MMSSANLHYMFLDIDIMHKARNNVGEGKNLYLKYVQNYIFFSVDPFILYHRSNISVEEPDIQKLCILQSA